MILFIIKKTIAAKSWGLLEKRSKMRLSHLEFYISVRVHVFYTHLGTKRIVKTVHCTCIFDYWKISLKVGTSCIIKIFM